MSPARWGFSTRGREPAGGPAAARGGRRVAHDRAFRLALPRTALRYAGGRELTLGDLGTEAGMLGGIKAIIVGNYLTTLGRPPTAPAGLTWPAAHLPARSGPTALPVNL
jgi:hypothetical protein